MLYFAYGSNLSLKRIQARIPTVQRVATAVARHHQLRFHKLGQDHSAKCDIFYTGDSSDHVYGVLYQFEQEHKAVLDRIEGLEHGYLQKELEVMDSNGDINKAFTYYATDIECEAKPFGWYHQHVLTGARENEFPADYVSQWIESVMIVDDPDNQRTEQELAIYSDSFERNQQGERT